MKPERIQFRADAVPEWDLEISTAAERQAAKQRDQNLPKYKAIRRGFVFSCFLESMAFVDRVADIAWEMDVEPSIYVHDDYVNIRIPGGGKGLNEVHFDLAEAIDGLVA